MKRINGNTPDNDLLFVRFLQKSALFFLAMASCYWGGIGLVGLFQAIVTPKMLASLFRGKFPA